MPRRDRLGRALPELRATPMAFSCNTNTASEAFCAFLDGLRASGTQFRGTNAQLMGLIVDALDVISPNTDAAVEDANTLARDFDAMIGGLTDGDTGLAVYDHDEED